MAMEARKPNIFDYNSAQTYLQDLYTYKRETADGRYNYSEFAALCGCGSEAGIRQILCGRR